MAHVVFPSKCPAPKVFRTPVAGATLMSKEIVGLYLKFLVSPVHGYLQSVGES